MEEYWNYIKWLGISLYKEKIELLGDINVGCVFHGEVTYKELADDMIFIIDCNSINESIYKLYKYQKKIEEKYKILDISLFKGNDKVNFSETYLIAIFCVDIKKYNENSEKYNSIFKQDLINLKQVKQDINEILNQEFERKVEVNNIPQNDDNKNINNLYLKMLKSIIDKNNYDLTELKNNRDKNKQDDFEYVNNYKKDEKNNKNLKNINIDYIDKILKIKDNRYIRKYRTENNIYKQKRIESIIDKISDGCFTCFVILDCMEEKLNKKIIRIFKRLKSKIIVISNDKNIYDKNVLVCSTLKKALKILEGYKYIYINNKGKEIKYDNVININIEQGSTLDIYKSIKKHLRSKDGLKSFANLDNVNSIKVLTGTFLNFEGSNYYSGGAERYLIDLHLVCKQLGMKLRIYQKANFDFFRYYNDIEIVGISHNQTKYNYEVEQNIAIRDRFNRISKNKTNLNIYSSFMECYGEALSPSVGISHGVAWDCKSNVYDGNLNGNAWIIDSAISCDKLVSVDTNTANYFQTVDFKLGNTTEVIPNYVDISEFSGDEQEKDTSKFVIVYPRRLYEARGLYLLLNVVDNILKKYENVEIHFVGKGFKEDTDKIQEKIDKWGINRIKMYNCPPEKMHEVYKIADISVIPTLYSEGTSLSCLEAMSTGNAVISTRVGGLTDLIINNYNGKLIEPNQVSLYNAICEFIDDPELMKKCQERAKEVAKVFNKDIWIEKWKKVINNYGKKKSSKEIINYNIVMIYVSDKNIESEKLNKLIFKKLLRNNVVYIVNNKVKKEDSYGRLQYLFENEDLYRQPDEILIDKEYENKDNISGKYVNF